ncbi:CoA pyrophosphatase [Stenoxybacter acetivorans]|uniref:CoA pyrophosphatase n=1 Tax=Stenoxybacter acetivorans TaxID=422441 RepID=UPI00068B8365|nr:CoA pyrophosphatase [Stenoxybacter acetivorans]
MPFQSRRGLTQFLQFACDNSHLLPDERTQLVKQLPLRFQATAVLLPFDWQDNGNACVWLTQRSNHLPHHAGQIAFPGGKVVAEDSSHLAAALRETQEELGVSPENWQIIGQLPVCYLPSGFAVTPFVALYQSKSADSPVWQPNPAEVTAVFSLPLHIALDTQHYRTEMVVHQQYRLPVYHLHFEQYDIWGATAAMLYQLAQNNAHRLPEPETKTYR